MSKKDYQIIVNERSYLYACDPNFTEYTTGYSTYYTVKAPNGKILQQTFITKEDAKRKIRELKRKNK